MRLPVPLPDQILLVLSTHRGYACGTDPGKPRPLGWQRWTVKRLVAHPKAQLSRTRYILILDLF